MPCPVSFDMASAGNTSATNMAVVATTATSSSTKVKPLASVDVFIFYSSIGYYPVKTLGWIWSEIGDLPLAADDLGPDH